MSRGTTITITTETVADLRGRQVIFPEWMRDAVAGLTDDDYVTVTREYAGFAGTFVLAIEAA